MQAELDAAAEMSTAVQQLMAELSEAQESNARLEQQVLRQQALTQAAQAQTKVRTHSALVCLFTHTRRDLLLVDVA